jgi:hypothetical protein
MITSRPLTGYPGPMSGLPTILQPALAVWLRSIIGIR